MARKTHFFDAVSISLGESLPCSHAGRAVAQLAVVGYRLGLFLAALLLPVAGGFVALSTETLPNRLMSAVFLGIFPVAACAAGWMLFWILKIASAVCDLIAAPLQLICRILADTARSGWVFFVSVIKDVVQWCVRAIKVFLHACHYGLQRVIAAAAFYSAITVRISMVAYRHFLMAITFPIRLVARILIAIIPQESARSKKPSPPRRVRFDMPPHSARFSTSHLHPEFSRRINPRNSFPTHPRG